MQIGMKTLKVPLFSKGGEGGFERRLNPPLRKGEYKERSPVSAGNTEMPKWRNWQTRKIQVLVGESLWGFESPLRHQFKKGRVEMFLLRPCPF